MNTMLTGIIIKGIGGFYYVKTEEGVVESRARGIFREEKITPLVGDRVKIRISTENNSGYIEEILPRDSSLFRPPVANVSQAIIVMSIKKPNINTWLLDKFLIMAEHENLKISICFNKMDLSYEETENLMKIYRQAGYNVFVTSAKDEEGIDQLRAVLKDNITVLAGPSGVGKSSLINIIGPDFGRETGEISHKSKRGKHTTRNVELLQLDDNSFILDTPGFSSLDLSFIEDESQLRSYYPEIAKYGRDCRFLSCLHHMEPDCAVKDHVEKGNISRMRYDNYLMLLEEIKNNRRY